jgi:hypothetical protein
MADGNQDQAADIRRAGAPKVNWDDSSMRSSYANVCNVSSTREEVVILFGTNQAWKGTEDEVTVQLSDRVILSPFAAKRLLLLLNNVCSLDSPGFPSAPSREGDGAQRRLRPGVPMVEAAQATGWRLAAFHRRPPPLLHRYCQKRGALRRQVWMDNPYRRCHW